jgi:hypothetical protein
MAKPPYHYASVELLQQVGNRPALSPGSFTSINL